MFRPTEVPSNPPISLTDFEKFKAGFKPTQPEDGWEINSTYLKEKDAWSVNWARMAFGHSHYVFVILPASAHGKGLSIESLIYESRTAARINITEEMAIKEAIFRARYDLGFEIEAHPNISFDEVFQYTFDMVY
ncbi:uncharacterized protein K489DRAFT_370245 [Dissoconium aciculare CBS 342.82]|jgi:hypothetical protein|uniref:Uncharacterized protein n=1 Tax=Dissoconium aciculare CBS 342.82 TaxID=1314786 RepID=A0A6J3M3X5_9PEZI|nr:uncharacterized protein K489DRAFT_370245 [Dissoconium aciculare CBS 342.82]KAF1822593.1 hypothetical protein K489DRAFT_370245 [Dissoconium aciculare CBS 342.82]